MDPGVHRRQGVQRAEQTDQADGRGQGGRRFAWHRVQRLQPPRDRARGSARARLAAAHKLGYAGPDPKGRLLRAGKVNAIGVATAEPLSYFFDDPFARVVMSGISQACDATGAGISLVSAVNEEQLAWNIQSALVDGFIVFCIEGGSRLVELTRERKLPFVALDFGFDDETIAAIGVDDVEGAPHGGAASCRTWAPPLRRAVAAFAEAGFGPASTQRVDGAVYSGTRDRLARLFRGARRVRHRYRDDADLRDGERRGDRQGRPRTHLRFRPSRRPRSWRCPTRMALFALDWLSERGIAVPQQVSIVGFDGVPEGEHSEPPLTTIAQPMAEMGRRAVHSILEFDGTVRRETLDVRTGRQGIDGSAAALGAHAVSEAFSTASISAITAAGRGPLSSAPRLSSICSGRGETGNRQCDRRPRQDPAERALGERAAARGQQFADRGEPCEIMRVGRAIPEEHHPFGIAAAHVVAGKLCARRVFAGEQAHGQRQPAQRDQSFALGDGHQLACRGEHVEVVLHRDETLARCVGGQTLGVIGAPAEAADLALAAQLAQRVEYRRCLTDRMLVDMQQRDVDAVALQAFARIVDRRANRRGRRIRRCDLAGRSDRRNSRPW